MRPLLKPLELRAWLHERESYYFSHSEDISGKRGVIVQCMKREIPDDNTRRLIIGYLVGGPGADPLSSGSLGTATVLAMWEWVGALHIQKMWLSSSEFREEIQWLKVEAKKQRESKCRP